MKKILTLFVVVLLMFGSLAIAGCEEPIDEGPIEEEPVEEEL